MPERTDRLRPKSRASTLPYDPSKVEIEYDPPWTFISIKIALIEPGNARSLHLSTFNARKKCSGDTCACRHPDQRQPYGVSGVAQTAAKRQELITRCPFHKEPMLGPPSLGCQGLPVDGGAYMEALKAGLRMGDILPSKLESIEQRVERLRPWPRCTPLNVGQSLTRNADPSGNDTLGSKAFVTQFTSTALLQKCAQVVP